MRRLCLIALLLLSQTALAVEPNVMFGSTRKDEVNVRSGPGTQFPILWVYKRFGYPLEIINTYQSWYQVRDVEGETGWVYKGLISKRRTTLVTEGDPLVLYKNDDATEPLLKFAPNVILGIDHCTPYLCKVVYGNINGWVIKKRLTMGIIQPNV